MIITILVILFTLWLFGFLSGAVGSLVHVLLIVCLVLLVVQLFGGVSRWRGD